MQGNWLKGIDYKTVKRKEAEFKIGLYIFSVSHTLCESPEIEIEIEI